MKHVLTLSENAEVELLRNILEEGGIHCVVKNEELAQTLPMEPFNAELWVLNDDDVPRARELCHDWFDPAPDALDIWVCPRCGERLGNRFDTCWKCGARHQIEGQPSQEGAVIV